MDVTKTITRNRICRFVVHTSAQTVAFDRNFDVGNSSVRSSIQTYDPWTWNFHTFTPPHPPLPSLKDQWLQYKPITYINRRKTYSALKKIVVSFHHPKEIAHLAFGCPLRVLYAAIFSFLFCLHLLDSEVRDEKSRSRVFVRLVSLLACVFFGVFFLLLLFLLFCFLRWLDCDIAITFMWSQINFEGTRTKLFTVRYL